MTDFDILPKTALYKAFSEMGKRIFLPDGIFYWSGRAKKEAEIRATIGAAYAFEQDFLFEGEKKWVTSYLGMVRNISNNMEELVPYASIDGLQRIRELWKDWIINKANLGNEGEKEHLKKYISNPIVTAGLTNALFIVLSLFLNENEKIIIPNKRWGNYDNIIKRLIGAEIESFQFFKNKCLNLKGLEETIDQVSKNQEKIILLLNFPNNPTGYVPTVKEVNELIDFIRRKRQELACPFVILIDDAYEPYVFSNNSMKHSIFYDLQQLDEDIIPVKLDGITKELLLYGGRIGFITIGLKQNWIQNEEDLEILKQELDNKLKGIIRSTISNSNRFYQNLVANLLGNNKFEDIIRDREKIVNLLKVRFEKINIELAQIKDSKFSVDPNAGGFFLFINLDPNEIKATDFADYLLKEYKVGVIPIENLEENINGIRIAYCSVDIEKIPELVRRISSALKNFED